MRRVTEEEECGDDDCAVYLTRVCVYCVIFSHYLHNQCFCAIGKDKGSLFLVVLYTGM